MKHYSLIILTVLCIFIAYSCQQQDITSPAAKVYSDSIYSLKTYLVVRHPTVLRNGFGMDIFHEIKTENDTCYLKSDTASFAWDLKFYNEQVYTQLSTGDYGTTGYPVIFLYADSANSEKSVKATLIGTGINCFNAFSVDSVARYVSRLKADPYIRLSKYRTTLHTASINGTVLLQSTADSLYTPLVIGMKFRPNVGGYFSIGDISDESQINLQPVFLIRTREGLYAKFMVTRFKGVGDDAQKTTMIWQAIR